MRKADNTIVFGSQNAFPPPPRTVTQPMATHPIEPVPASIPIPAPEPPMSVRMRPLVDDLVDERRYIGRPERGLAFVAVSLALIGVAAAGTYFFFGSREPVSTTTTTSAEVKPQEDIKPVEATPTVNPEPAAAAPPAPAPTPSDLPWNEPKFDAVRAPALKAQTPAVLPKEVPGAQVMPTERPQATNQANPYASKIQSANFPGAPSTAKEVPPRPPPANMSDEALERAGYYGRIAPIAPTETNNAAEPKVPSDSTSPGPVAPSQTNNVAEPKMPNAASTEEPKQFTPPDVMPEMKIKQ